MDEKYLKKVLTAKLRKTRPNWVVLRIETGETTAGVPDLLVVGEGFTSLWEGKYANPDFKSKGIQELTCLRLDRAGYCRYIVWQELDETKRTLIMKPSEMHNWTDLNLIPENANFYDDTHFNMEWIIDYIIKVHNDHRR